MSRERKRNAALNSRACSGALTYMKNRGIDPFHHARQLPKGLKKEDALALLKAWGFDNN